MHKFLSNYFCVLFVVSKSCIICSDKLLILSVPPSISLDPVYANGVDVRSGLDLAIDAFITGKPKPQIRWNFGETLLKSTSDGAVQIETTRTRSSLLKRYF